MAAAQWSRRSFSNISPSCFRSFSSLQSSFYIPKVSCKPLEYCCIRSERIARNKWYLYRIKHKFTSSHLSSISHTRSSSHTTRQNLLPRTFFRSFRKNNSKDDSSVSSAGSSGDNADDGGDDDGEDVIIEDKVGDKKVEPEYGALAPVMVPEVFPRVPLLCVHRNPVFPRFVKMLEVTDKRIMDLIRRKCKMNQPYAGTFLKKDDNDEAEVVKSLDEIYKVGTFVQITELHDTGDRIRMIILGHRRITITEIISDEDEMAEPVEMNNQENALEPDEIAAVNEVQLSSEQALPLNQDSQIIQMVKVENVLHAPFKLTQEVKAVAAEVIKTIRDIIALNQLYKESLAQLIEAGKKVVDNPTHLADFGKFFDRTAKTFVALDVDQLFKSRLA